MDEVRAEYEHLNTRADIDQALQRYKQSNADGESSTFEFKGTAGKGNIKKSKDKFAKEISAFANTYGGILCIHKGTDTTLEPFTPTEVADINTRLEGWLHDWLQPPLQGIELKPCDGVFIVHIPQSLTKPHRSALDRDYYFRHNTQSRPMPEVMVSAMYRSQDYLATSLSMQLHTHGGQALVLRLDLQNESMIAGTKPRIVIQIFSSQSGMVEPIETSKHFEFFSDSYSHPFGNIPELFINGLIGTTDRFQERILYPQDHFLITCFLKPHTRKPLIETVRFFLIRADYFFLEIPRQIRYLLIHMEEGLPGQTIVGTIIATGSEQDAAGILHQYLNAISADEDTTSPSEVEPEEEGE